MTYFLTCRIGREWYGIQIEHVVEVLHIVALNQIPGDDVIGVMTLREQVIPVIDLRQFFDLQADEYHLDMPIVALKHEQQQIGAIIDDADDVVSITEDDMTAYDEQGIRAVARVNDQMLFILDVPYILQSLKQDNLVS